MLEKITKHIVFVSKKVMVLKVVDQLPSSVGIHLIKFYSS